VVLPSLTSPSILVFVTRLAAAVKPLMIACAPDRVAPTCRRAARTEPRDASGKFQRPRAPTRGRVHPRPPWHGHPSHAAAFLCFRSARRAAPSSLCQSSSPRPLLSLPQRNPWTTRTSPWDVLLGRRKTMPPASSAPTARSFGASHQAPSGQSSKPQGGLSCTHKPTCRGGRKGSEQSHASGHSWPSHTRARTAPRCSNPPRDRLRHYTPAAPLATTRDPAGLKPPAWQPHVLLQPACRHLRASFKTPTTSQQLAYSLCYCVCIFHFQNTILTLENPCKSIFSQKNTKHFLEIL
jgi:hypothetical protein